MFPFNFFGVSDTPSLNFWGVQTPTTPRVAAPMQGSIPPVTMTVFSDLETACCLHDPSVWNRNTAAAICIKKYTETFTGTLKSQRSCYCLRYVLKSGNVWIENLAVGAYPTKLRRLMLRLLQHCRIFGRSVLIWSSYIASWFLVSTFAL